MLHAKSCSTILKGARIFFPINHWKRVNITQGLTNHLETEPDHFQLDYNFISPISGLKAIGVILDCIVFRSYSSYCCSYAEQLHVPNI